MTPENGHSREFATLLEKWCEDRLSAQELRRLEQLVLSDSRAMRRYLAYVQLHGTLHWDTAVSGETSVVAADLSSDGAGRCDSARRAAERDPQARDSVRQPAAQGRRRWMAVAVYACLLAVAAIGFRLAAPVGQQADPVAAHPQEPRATDVPSVPTNTEPARAAPLPVVRLDRQTAEPDPADPDPVDAGPLEAGAVQADPVGPELANKLSEKPSDGPPSGSPEEVTNDIVAFIDRELASGWESAGATPASVANDGEWLRRAALDLSGQIPTLEVLEEFTSDPSPYKRALFVERMLSDDLFAQHFTTVWANQLVGRSSESAHERHGIERFLGKQFRQNRPWNETVAELIAAEGTVRENGASGFLLAHLNDQAVPATAITARLFLGEQVQCTQCHNHPFNEWRQEQFWKLNAFFQQAKIKVRTLTDASGKSRKEPALVNASIGGPTYFENRRGVMQATYPAFDDEPVDPGPDTNRRRKLADLLSEGDDTQLARAFVNRMWAHFFGYGFSNPVDDMGPHHPPSYPQVLDRLSREFVAADYDIRQLVRWITTTRAYHLSSRLGDVDVDGDGVRIAAAATDDATLFCRVPAKPLTPEQVFASLQVATWGEAHSSDVAGRRKEQETWVQQFFEVLENEEDGEVSTFGGSITQALTMMNGPLLTAAIRDEPGTVFHQFLTARMDDEERIRMLCRVALSRDPSPTEMSRFRRIVGQARSVRDRDPRAAVNESLRDIYWAYLNSGEFLTNH